LARFRRVRLRPLVFGEAFFETLCWSRSSYGAGGRCYCNSRVAFFVAVSLPMSQVGWDSLYGAIDRNPVAFDARRVTEFHSSVAVPNDRFPSREPKSPGALRLWSAWIGFGGYKVDLRAVIYLKF
jgi:hypothetical protein